MKKIIFAFPGNEALARKMSLMSEVESGEIELRNFPDRETYVRILSDVKGKMVIIVATLHPPNEMFLPLFFLAKTAKSLGAERVELVAPYLAYMRQDKIFNPGEGVTSEYFAELLSGFVDSLITIDPHLHRRKSLSQIYSIPAKAVSAVDPIALWIEKNVAHPFLIGPDSESEQWVSEIASKIKIPFVILAKVRHGDRDVEVSLPDLERFKSFTPVLIDDIISTARTMIEATIQLVEAGTNPPICIGVHAVFSGKAYQDLLKSGVAKIITCNTIFHESNAIDISKLLTQKLKK